MTIKPALFLDLDKTVRYNSEDPDGFINDAETIALYEDVEDKIWEYKNDGFLVIGITNQGGVAFDHKSIEQAKQEVVATIKLFERNPFDHIYISPYHEDGHIKPYNRRSLLRKPHIGMLAIAENDFATAYGIYIDLDNSILVGDRKEDEECARNANITFVHSDTFFGRSIVE